MSNMSRMFYPKLALMNIKNNGKTYFPYLLTCIGTIIMFYIMHSISINDGLNHMAGGNNLKFILDLGNYVIAIFSIIFLFYTNSFLIKRRKKELGLYNILGMEKRHIAKVLTWEAFLVSITTLTLGLLGGIIASKLMFLVLLRIINFAVPMGFFISVPSIVVTIILFVIIFGLTLLNNLRQIQLAKPIELLKGGQTGEKEPKTKIILTLFGVISLASGYYIAQTTESPLDALYLFFIAVVLVIIGTYALFTAGSIALLKLLRQNKKFYYQAKHFTSVSGMIYRMKQNAVGLANICILSTMVLVMLSTTVSLYIGMEDVLKTRYPRSIEVNASNISNEKKDSLNQVISEQADKLGITLKDKINYRFMPIYMVQDNDNSFSSGSSYYRAGNNICSLTFIPLSDFNNMENQSISLAENEILLYSFRGKVSGDTINLSGQTFKVKDHLKDLAIDSESPAMDHNSYYLVFSDEQTINKLYRTSIENSSDARENKQDLAYYLGFNTNGDAIKEIELTKAIGNKLNDSSISGYAQGLEASRETFFSLYGGLFFLGLFLGALFIMATVLIIYYKQVSEGYDDKERFQIMQKVGMSKREVKRSIRSQVLMVFFLPLIAAVVHIGFAFKMITKLLALLNLTNVTLFVLCSIGTILIFAIFYAIVYLLTARVYYKIVS
ncbi:ABC transporter permease [Desulfitobacterium sp. AusDCA]